MPRAPAVLKQIVHFLMVAAGALSLTFAFFLLLPLIQAITAPSGADLLLLPVDAAHIPPPPPPPEEEKPEEEPEPEEKPPELEEEAPPLDLAQIELALNPSVGSGLVSADLAVRIGPGAGGGSGEELAGLFSLADLDQKPRVIYQPSPVLDANVRAKAPGKVYVIFIVDERGRVENPIVQSSTDPIFEAPALAAVKQWKFEPAKRNGVVVRFRMRAPITFPKSG